MISKKIKLVSEKFSGILFNFNKSTKYCLGSKFRYLILLLQVRARKTKWVNFLKPYLFQIYLLRRNLRNLYCPAFAIKWELWFQNLDLECSSIKIFIEQFDNKFQYLYSENARINPDGGFDYTTMPVSFQYTLILNWYRPGRIKEKGNSRTRFLLKQM